MNSDINQLASLAHSQPIRHPTEPVQDIVNGNKRKTDDDQTASKSSKRSRYISLACNECKRRKIKCNGQTPCQRCGNLNLDCVYAPNCCTGFKDSQEFKDLNAHIGALQDQVNLLYENISSLRAHLGHDTPLQQHNASTARQGQQHKQSQSIDPALQLHVFHENRLQQASPSEQSNGQLQQSSTFRGLTSADFNFSVAKSSLQTMGIHAQENKGGDDAHDNSGEEAAEEGAANRFFMPWHNGQLLETLHPSKDPIWSINQEEALRLCDVYEDETKTMYPVLAIENVKAHVRKLYMFLEAMHRTGLMQQGIPGTDAVEDEDTNVLKMAIAIALTVEGGGRSALGKRFFDSVQPMVDNLLLGDVSIKGIRLLVMTAVYEFQRDNESTSWRLIGLAARLCIELGLHRHETYDTLLDSQRTETMLLFWACYVLDRRWSLGTGMPFALQDADIDPALPRPGEESPYLMAMIKYGEIGSKVWSSLAAPPSADNGGISPIDIDKMMQLDYQVLQWYSEVPETLRYHHGEQQLDGESLVDKASLRSKLAIYLRANQMRILIHRPILHSATTIMQNRELAQKVVDIAKDTIQVLTHINRTTDLYATQQVVLHAFLTSALAVLFLSISHTPAEFASQVREEFYMALDLVRGLSKGSFVSKRLWTTMRGLKEIAPKLGLDEVKPDISHNGAALVDKRSTDKGDVDPSRSAAVAMAGLAGHNVDELALYDGESPRTSPTESESCGHPDKMANDLVRLFEAASNMPDSDQTHDSFAEAAAAQQQMGTPGYRILADTPAGEAGLSNVLKALF